VTIDGGRRGGHTLEYLGDLGQRIDGGRLEVHLVGIEQHVRLLLDGVVDPDTRLDDRGECEDPNRHCGLLEGEGEPVHGKA